MRTVWTLTLVPTCIVAAALLASCGDGDGCGSGGATAPCPVQTYGWARVGGTVLDEDATPVPGERVLFICPDGVGANDGLSDAEGRYRGGEQWRGTTADLSQFPAALTDVLTGEIRPNDSPLATFLAALPVAILLAAKELHFHS